MVEAPGELPSEAPPSTPGELKHCGLTTYERLVMSHDHFACMDGYAGSNACNSAACYLLRYISTAWNELGRGRASKTKPGDLVQACQVNTSRYEQMPRQCWSELVTHGQHINADPCHLGKARPCKRPHTHAHWSARTCILVYDKRLCTMPRPYLHEKLKFVCMQDLHFSVDQDQLSAGATHTPAGHAVYR